MAKFKLTEEQETSLKKMNTQLLTLKKLKTVAEKLRQGAETDRDVTVIYQLTTEESGKKFKISIPIRASIAEQNIRHDGKTYAAEIQKGLNKTNITLTDAEREVIDFFVKTA